MYMPIMHGVANELKRHDQEQCNATIFSCCAVPFTIIAVAIFEATKMAPHVRAQRNSQLV